MGILIDFPASNMLKTYHAIGLMSGSSLDGLDIAYCRFDWDGTDINSWELLQAETLAFSEIWQRRLSALPQQNALSFAQTDIYFSYYMGELLNSFTKKYKIDQIDFVASHGHTVFHDPSRRYSIQIGNGNALAATIGKTVVCDFRMQDIALNGEGAPLAPLADAYLFPGFDFYMNIGGIANISAKCKDKWVAFDFSPASQIFNFLANQLGMPYDEDGKIARTGKPNFEFLADLQSADYYCKPYPKSMGNEWIAKEVLPLFSASGLTIETQMATAVELFVNECGRAIDMICKKENFKKEKIKMLLSGGSAHNCFLVEQLGLKLASRNVEIILPDKSIINFKEAMLIALLGLLRIEAVPNSMPAVTGAKKASINGGVYFAK
jgi:anhydro-N-acetylmuramic acid kinase